MNWQQALAEIESVEFDVQLNVVSSFGLFLNAARDEPAVTVLYQAMQASEEVSDTVLERVCELSTQDIDTRYANTNDAALTVYLWLLCQADTTRATAAAFRVIHAPNCHYAWKMSQSVLLQALTPDPTEDIQTGHNSNAGDGWATGGAFTQPAAASQMFNLLAHILDHQTPLPSIVPTWEGGVQVEWHRNGVDLEIESMLSGEIEFFFNDQSIECEGQAWEEIDRLGEFARAVI